MNKEEVKKLMALPEMKEAVMIGSVDDRENYFPAIIGHDPEHGRFIYDYDLLCQCFADEFRKSDESNKEAHTEEDYDTMGVEWVEFNVIRSLPYWGEHAPEISYGEEVEDDDENAQSRD